METIICPRCATRLMIGDSSPDTIVVCAECQAQFSPDGRWPLAVTSRKAVYSLVLGVLSLGCLFVTGIPAFVLGLSALGDMRHHGSRRMLKGKAMAITGAALGGFCSLAVFVVPLVALPYVSRVAGRQVRPRMVTRQSMEIPQPAVIPEDAVIIAEIHAALPWKWLHPGDGVDPAESDPDFHESFYDIDFDDADWQGGEVQGLAESSSIGYGDDVAVDIGEPDAGSRFTAYVRVWFNAAQAFNGLLLTYYRDDGTIIYLDGNEVARDNIRQGPEAYRLLAERTVGSGNEETIVGVTISETLEPGEHLLAISLHNVRPDSSDLRIGAVTLHGRPRK